MLASASPRRADLLAAAGFRFEVAPTDVDETPRPGEAALPLCERLARDKAAAGARGRGEGTVLGGDTIVVLDGEVLGKPADASEAADMLGRLAGRAHEVASAVALLHVPTGRVVADVAVSRVGFAPLDEAAVADYVAGGEWEGKAGAYAIQGEAGSFARLEAGDLDTVIGLPVALVRRLVGELRAATALHGNGGSP